MAVVGLGLGLLHADPDPRHAERRAAAGHGRRDRLLDFFRQMGGTLGTAVFLSLLFSTVGDKIA